MRRSPLFLVAPWVPPARGEDLYITMPPPPGGELGGSPGISQGYSDRLARTPYWKRMALSGSFAFRMRENATRYPMSHFRPGQYDMRYTVMPYPDHHHPAYRPLLEVGEARQIPGNMKIPVIFLANVMQKPSSDAEEVWLGRKHETVYVPSVLARESLLPQRLAVYATEEAYRLLGLPVKRHSIHHEIPKSKKQYQKIFSQQHYQEERWKYDDAFRFRAFMDGPPALREWYQRGSKAGEGAAEWEEEAGAWLAQVSGAGLAAGTASAGGEPGDGPARGPRKMRKARKIKLF